NMVMGGLLIIYTVTGGAKAVAYTQQLQLFIIFAGMFVAGYYMVHKLPDGMGFTDALKVSGASGKLNVITTGITEIGFDWKDKYNLISGLIGGFFLALSYFGTDQSQVGRYLTAKDVTESKMSLLLNGIVKIPMQFLILLMGALLFAFYSFTNAPVFFDQATQNQAMQTAAKPILLQQEQNYAAAQAQYQYYVKRFTSDELQTSQYKDSIKVASKQVDSLRKAYKQTIQKSLGKQDVNDTNYIFLRFVIDNLPKGLVGLLIAIIFLAAWGSIAAALNSLAGCTIIDFHMLLFPASLQNADMQLQQQKQYRYSKFYTLLWGAFSVATAQFASGLGSLIEAVNVLGSLFYGVILGIFLVGFYLKHIGGKAVFAAAIIGELLVILCFWLDKKGIIGLGFLWLNVLGALLVVIGAWLLNF
ncbi:MAG: sodium:solute symporter family transporter, partial [Chitinophagaceae bacterium]